MRRISRLLSLPTVAVALGACTDPMPTEAPRNRGMAPTPVISDGAHGGSTRFYFLPPLVSSPAYSGTFDGSAFGPGSTDLVTICEIAAGSCVSQVGAFGYPDVLVEPATESYHLKWPAKAAALDPAKLYRIVVTVGGQVLGYADAVVLTNASGKNSVDNTQYVTILVNPTAQIRFRIETGGAPPPPSGNVVSIATGQYHSCAVTTANAAYCWGYNVWGQVGDLSTNDRLSPVLVTGTHAFNRISAGLGHTCALTLAQAMYCWGSGNVGQLGNGTWDNHTSPTPVNGGLAFTSIATANNDSCGRTSVGTVYCWGYNSAGQVGDGTMILRDEPVAVQQGGLSFDVLSAGGASTCGLAGGGAYCWGNNDNGQLGDGSTTNRSTPTAVLGGALTFASISVGGAHTCALTTAGKAYCWGFNIYGQLGNNSTTNSLVPAEVQTGLTFSSIAAGWTSTCAVTTTSDAYCWGHNFYGQVGNGTTNHPVLTPSAVTGGVKFAALSGGGLHVCGRSTTNALYCWGYNGMGGIGDGTTTNRSAPTLITVP